MINTASAQVCTPIDTFTEAGLYPAPDELDCVIQGEPIDVTIQFKNFDQAAGFTVNWLRVDSITNMPCGAEYAVSETDLTFDSGEAGCIQVSGTTNDAAGQYKLGIYVTIDVSILGELSGEAGEIASSVGAGDFSYYVRVKESGGTCVALDTSANANNLTATCPTVDITNSVGINDLSSQIENFKFYPNPTSNTANVSFVSEKYTQYTTRIVNIFGQEMSRETLNVQAGLNTIKVDVSTLPTGVYMYTINDGKAAYTHRFVVE